MAEKKREPKKPEKETTKKAEKKAETVLLSPDELKAISGGQTTYPPTQPKHQDVHRQ
jgi:hypothetical protein